MSSSTSNLGSNRKRFLGPRKPVRAARQIPMADEDGGRRRIAFEKIRRDRPVMLGDPPEETRGLQSLLADLGVGRRVALWRGLGLVVAAAIRPTRMEPDAFVAPTE